MNLSFKDTKFIIEALNHLQTAYNKRLSEIEDFEEYEDEASELGNDILFLESLLTELEKSLNENKTYSLLTLSNIHRQKEKATYDDSLVHLVLELSINERLLLVEAISESIRHDNSFKAS
jgi:hypothetical protein